MVEVIWPKANLKIDERARRYIRRWIGSFWLGGQNRRRNGKVANSNSQRWSSDETVPREIFCALLLAATAKEQRGDLSARVHNCHCQFGLLGKTSFEMIYSALSPLLVGMTRGF